MGMVSKLLKRVQPIAAPAGETPVQANARILSSVGLDTVLTPLNKKKKNQILTVLPGQTTEETKDVFGY